MHNEQCERTYIVIKDIQKNDKNDIGTYYLNIHFSLYIRPGKQILNN